jgi:arabinan endo-1,5-alpha-L-arabinosidase
MSAQAGVASFVNPLKGDCDVHDPVMSKEGNTYYVFWTGDFIKIKTSTDRMTWKNTGTVFNASAPSWFKTFVPDNNGRDIWAPDISFRDGKWWLYYSVSTFGSRVSAIGLATNAALNSADPDYKWVDQGMVINSTTNNNYNCIDPNAFQDDDNTLWLIFGSWSTGIKLVQLDPTTGKLLDATPTLTSLASHSSGIEGAFLIKWKSYYYLFVSWDNCCKGVSSNYKIAVGRASALKGPYVDKKNKSMTSGAGELLDTGDAIRRGPGHNGIFIEHDTVFCVNHYYDASRSGAATLQIRPVYWDRNDWPSLNPLTDSKRRSSSVDRFAFHRLTAVRLIGRDANRYCKTSSLLFSVSGQRIKYEAARALTMRLYIEKRTAVELPQSSF